MSAHQNDDANTSFMTSSQAAEVSPGIDEPAESLGQKPSGHPRRKPHPQEAVPTTPLAQRDTESAARWRRRDRKGEGQGS